MTVKNKAEGGVDQTCRAGAGCIACDRRMCRAAQAPVHTCGGHVRCSRTHLFLMYCKQGGREDVGNEIRAGARLGMLSVHLLGCTFGERAQAEVQSFK